MHKIIRIASFTATLSAVLLIGGVAAEASHSWGGYHWARTTPSFTLKLGDNVNGTWDSYLAAASSAWSADPTLLYPTSGIAKVLTTTIVPGQGGSNCKAQTGRVEVCNRSYGNNGWLGLAQIWLSGTHITKGTVKFNDTYFNNSFYNNPNERLHVVCQEVGHTFGLDHQSTDGSSLNTCMDYFSNTGVNSGSTLSTLPNRHDYEELATIYTHLDTTTTVGQTTGTKGAADVDVSDRNEWGKEMSRSANGHESVFERDLGNGNKVLTHVFWAEEKVK